MKLCWFFWIKPTYSGSGKGIQAFSETSQAKPDSCQQQDKAYHIGHTADSFVE
jgi:hypothetical protein